MDKNNLKRLQAFIHGTVQGVGFRYFVYQLGINLHLNGWVRNRISGEVEILAEGPHNILSAFLREIRKGPQTAHVEDIHVDWQEPQRDLPPFTILNTR